MPSCAALSRLRIIDLTHVRSGPTCVKQFADFGADVIKVESPPALAGQQEIGAPRDGYEMQNLHRNKRSLTLNLKAPEGREIFHKLVRTADVVVENYRPDVKQRLGFDYETLRAINRRIILASISGFGQDGPYRDRPGMDQIAQGMSGLMSVTGFPQQAPIRSGAAIVDVTAGLFAALGIMTALLERESSGEGQWVQSSLLQSGIALMDFQAARYLLAGEVPERVGNDHPYIVPTSAYRTADGYINVATFGNPIWERLCRAIGRPDLLEREAFATPPSRVTHRAEINRELSAAFATKGSAEWIGILNEAGVPCGPIYSVDEVFADPHVRHLQQGATVQHPRLGQIELVNQAVKLSRTPAALKTPTPDLGAHTDPILGELGYGAKDVALLRAKNVV
jgi:crotonobetainyl-CoA:carnitine CoA-transferase CaiB-like acyl-CoA transferase